MSRVVAKPASSRVERARGGDRAATASFLREHERGLYAFFSARHWPWSMLPDLVQETHARACQAFPTLRAQGEDEAKRWLFGIARHVHLQEISRQVGIRLRQDVAQEVARQVQPGNDGTYFMTDLLDALDELPLVQLEALRLRLEGLTIREIAAELEVPDGTVATRIHRARKLLRVLLGFGLPG